MGNIKNNKNESENDLMKWVNDLTECIFEGLEEHLPFLSNVISALENTSKTVKAGVEFWKRRETKENVSKQLKKAVEKVDLDSDIYLKLRTIIKKKEFVQFIYDNKISGIEQCIPNDEKLLGIIKRLFPEIRGILVEQMNVDEKSLFTAKSAIRIESNMATKSDMAEIKSDMAGIKSDMGEIKLNMSNELFRERKADESRSPKKPFPELLDDCYQRQKKGKNQYGRLVGRSDIKSDISKCINKCTNEEIPFIWMIGPAGAGKTHIGWDIACNNDEEQDNKISCEKIYYFNKQDLLTLKSILEYTPESIKIESSILFICDYVYDHSESIRDFLKILKERKGENKIAVIFIERDSKMASEGLPKGEQFYINRGEGTYTLSKDELKMIMKHKLKGKYEEAMCSRCVNQVIKKIDKNYQRPIFVTLFAEILEGMGQAAIKEFNPQEINNIDDLLKSYWTNKYIKFLNKYEPENNEERKDIEQFEKFPKMLLLCATVLECDIRIVRNRNSELQYEIRISKTKGNDYCGLIEFLTKELKEVPEHFLKEGFISYIEEFCEAQIVRRDIEIIIKPALDLVSEWIIHKEIKEWLGWGNNKSWLPQLVFYFRQYQAPGFLPLIYRGITDFSNIIELSFYVLETPGTDSLSTDDFCELIVSIFKYEQIYRLDGTEFLEIKLNEFNKISELIDVCNIPENIHNIIKKKILGKSDYDIVKEKGLEKSNLVDIKIEYLYERSKAAQFVNACLEMNKSYTSR